MPIFAPLLVAIALAAVAPGQRGKAVDMRTDPFTKGDAELMRAAGLEAYPPFHFAGGHDTAKVELELALEGKIAWAETRHFKIGISLAPRPWPTEKEEKKTFNEEVKAIAAVLPEVKKQRQVTSWLLVHVYARRLEELYADVGKRFGCDDRVQPITDGRGHDSRQDMKQKQLGTGPFLGQHGKFCLLIVERRSDLARYFRAFAERDALEGTCHHFIESNSLVYVTTPDIRTGGLATERALHCNVVYGVVRNLLTGLRGFTYDIPVWNVEGLAHWYRLRLDTDYNTIMGLPERQWGLLQDVDWGVKAKARATSGAYSKSEELLDWFLPDVTDFHKHVMMWSRVDYLLEQGDEKYAKYLAILKSLPTTGVPTKLVLDTQRKALQEVYGFDDAGFDEAWASWAREKY